jgi:hypothetical protein
MSEANPKDFEDFLLEEYQNIAQAHFKSIETISTFFRYYLLIMSIPISVIAVISQISSEKINISFIIANYNIPISILLFCISFIGLGIFSYVANLRLDAILYARAVNGIRKYFYDESSIDLNLKIRMRALPQSPQLPLYYEKSLFLPVVFVFGLMNSLYFLIGSSVLAFGKLPYEQSFVFIEGNLIEKISYIIVSNWVIALSSSIFFFAHFGVYLYLSRHRESGYLRSNIMGIDIDGVLNKHRDHFCSLLLENTGISLDPERIVVMPVHEDPNLHIQRDDERAVFNDPRYWIEMPVVDKAVCDRLRSLKNIFKFKLYIFTYRPWPDYKVKWKEPKNKKSKENNEIIKRIDTFIRISGCCSIKKQIAKWKGHLRIAYYCTPIMKWLIIILPKSFIKSVLSTIKAWCLFGLLKLRFLHKNWLIEKIIKPLKETPLKFVTEEWLNKKGIPYDKFIFEKGNDYSSDPKGEFTNRFHISKKMKIKFFIEDDLEKAIKLSYICDVCFLFSQPYNLSFANLPLELKEKRENFPTNIIRVKDWGEIYKYIRRLA